MSNSSKASSRLAQEEEDDESYLEASMGRSAPNPFVSNEVKNPASYPLGVGRIQRASQNEIGSSIDAAKQSYGAAVAESGDAVDGGGEQLIAGRHRHHGHDHGDKKNNKKKQQQGAADELTEIKAMELFGPTSFSSSFGERTIRVDQRDLEAFKALKMKHEHELTFLVEFAFSLQEAAANPDKLVWKLPFSRVAAKLSEADGGRSAKNRKVFLQYVLCPEYSSDCIPNLGVSISDIKGRIEAGNTKSYSHVIMDTGGRLHRPKSPYVLHELTSVTGSRDLNSSVAHLTDEDIESMATRPSGKDYWLVGVSSVLGVYINKNKGTLIPKKSDPKKKQQKEEEQKDDDDDELATIDGKDYVLDPAVVDAGIVLLKKLRDGKLEQLKKSDVYALENFELRLERTDVERVDSPEGIDAANAKDGSLTDYVRTKLNRVSMIVRLNIIDIPKKRTPMAPTAKANREREG